jgi:hypothetical protein
MWFEYIRYRFRLDAHQNGLELAQLAALRGLRHSVHCRGWRVLPAPGDPSRSILEIEWDPGASLTPFYGSAEFVEIHAALIERVRALEEADYCADTRLSGGILGGDEALLGLAENIVTGVMSEPCLGWRFQSPDDSRRGRLALWLLEVLGGPDLFSWSFPDAIAREGPLARELLDLEERERLLEIAGDAMANWAGEQGGRVLGTLRAHLPLYPPPQSRLDIDARHLRVGATTWAPAGVGAPTSDIVARVEPASAIVRVAPNQRTESSASDSERRPRKSARSRPVASSPSGVRPRWRALRNSR